IAADIVVERASQKKIIIGAKGSAIKKLGQKSREEIEDHLGMPVFLELFVKVREHWRSDPGMLRSFGFNPKS
ncbi:MAG: KH domain-containing protein, partial [Candidatus Kapaibacterium sp.]